VTLTIPEELAIRPATLDDFTGQDELKTGLATLVEAAIDRGELPDHTLFYGPPGLGKTTLARIMANELETPIKIVSGPSIGTPGDLADILIGLGRGVLFIDEIHRMSMAVEEVLYSAMEDFTLDLALGKDTENEKARVVNIALSTFTLVGATTRLGDLSNPLRDRFGATYRLDYYHADQLAAIGKRTALVLKAELTNEAAFTLAGRARGTPRIMNRLVRRARDVAQLAGDPELPAITDADAEKTCRQLGIDDLGLDDMDRRLLFALADLYNGGPVGLKTLGALISEPPTTVETAIEPHLMRLELLKRTERGRMLAPKGWDYVLKARAGK
jgi:Holliday junction DNA helicase RuvB